MIDRRSIAQTGGLMAAIYARKSDDQSKVAEDARSVTRQVEHASAYIARKGWALDPSHVYSDEVSGAEFARRPGFLRLMNALKPAPPFQVLVMSDSDRLGREQIETAYAMKQLITAGVRVFLYLDDRELTLKSPTDKLLLSVATFAGEVERDKSRQRTKDALMRRAEQGYIAAGRCYGFDSIAVDGHKERRVNEPEAAVIRRIFSLASKGIGFKAIAMTLNDDGAVPPRPYNRRDAPPKPRAWATSSVREILHREAYRGRIIYNKSQKRDAWGQAISGPRSMKARQRPESEWIVVERPELQIVGDELWAAAHERLTATRATYLRATGGRLFGKPINGEQSPYLLSGFAQCGVCGGSLSVRGKGRGYSCTTFVTRGEKGCTNRIAMPAEPMHRAVIEAVMRDVLDPDVITDAIAAAVKRLADGNMEGDQRERLGKTLANTEKELGNLAAAIAGGTGESQTIVEAIRARERERARLRQRLAEMEAIAAIPAAGDAATTRELRTMLDEWREFLGGAPAQVRQILRKLLVGRLVFDPDRRGRRRYTFRGTGRIDRLVAGVVAAPIAVVAPTGFEPVFRP